MTELDRDVVRRKLADLDQYLGQVSEYRDITAEQYRNVIVHDYARVDPAIVVQILREHLGDFTRFRTAVLGWI